MIAASHHEPGSPHLVLLLTHGHKGAHADDARLDLGDSGGQIVTPDGSGNQDEQDREQKSFHGTPRLVCATDDEASDSIIHGGPDTDDVRQSPTSIVNRQRPATGFASGIQVAKMTQRNKDVQGARFFIRNRLFYRAF